MINTEQKNYIVTRTVDSNKDELYHWKYTDKYKKNGKWRYIYKGTDNGKYKAEEVRRAEEAYKDATEASSRAREKSLKYQNYYFDKDHPGTFAAEKQQAMMAEQRTRADAERAYQQMKDIQVSNLKYNKSLQGKIDRAFHKVSTFLNTYGIRVFR